MTTLKKCLVLDLDNTLWGGVVGEDGMEGLALSLTAPGASFVAFQQAILDLYNRGVILAINSRNNPAEALEVIRTHPNMILKENHFAAMRLNWNNKADNLKEIAKELNVGLDSLVFLDDDRMNREMVKATVPEVLVPELPDNPEEYAKFLISLDCFPKEALTDEDKMRGNYYVTERLRTEAEKNFASPEEFVKSLDIETVVRKNNKENMARLSQLTEKTNQFNFAKRPIDINEMERLIDDERFDVWEATVRDKFGDYGLTGWALVEKRPDSHHIENFLLSCRVLGRGVEGAFLKAITEEAKGAKITADFKKSEKNAPAEQFVNQRFVRDGELYILKHG